MGFFEVRETPGRSYGELNLLAGSQRISPRSPAPGKPGVPTALRAESASFRGILLWQDLRGRGLRFGVEAALLRCRDPSPAIARWRGSHGVTSKPHRLVSLLVT